jgi:hypothetical protein
MTDIFDSIPLIAVVLTGLGLAGVMIYERTRIRQEKKSSN